MVGTWVVVAAYFILLGTTCSILGTAIARKLAIRFGVLDHPHERAIHKEPTPLLGGMGIAVAMILVVWGHLVAGYLGLVPAGLKARIPAELLGRITGFSNQLPYLLLLFGGGVVMAMLGLWDDVKGLTIRRRIYVEFAVATVVVALGIRPTLSFFPDPLAVLIGVIWLVGITNSFNLLDGADGLAGGIGAISSLNLGILMLVTKHPSMAVFMFVLAGACFGFLRYNWHPARIFMGSMGSLFIGYMLGASTLVATFATPEAPPLFPLLIPILIFAVPLYDTASVIVIRLKRNASIFKGDRSHLHHRLMRLGFSTRQTVAFMYIMSIAFGLGAMLIPRMDILGSTVILVQALVLISLIALMERIASGKNGDEIPARAEGIGEKGSREWLERERAEAPKL